MHIVIRVDKESLKKSHQHANEANVCSKYQPCSQAAFSLFYEAWTLSNISDDVAFMAQSIPSVNIAPPPPLPPPPGMLGICILFWKSCKCPTVGLKNTGYQCPTSGQQSAFSSK